MIVFLEVKIVLADQTLQNWRADINFGQSYAWGKMGAPPPSPALNPPLLGIILVIDSNYLR